MCFSTSVLWCKAIQRLSIVEKLSDDIYAQNLDFMLTWKEAYDFEYANLVNGATQTLSSFNWGFFSKFNWVGKFFYFT